LESLSSTSSLISETLASNAEFALPLIFALACLEALVGIGLFVSGAFLLGVVSYCLAQDLVSPTLIFLTALGGATAGDHAGYYAGRMWGPRFHLSRFAIKYHARITRTESMIARWGGVAVAIGRFVPAIRSIVPAMLGISGLTRLRFSLIDFTSCAAWALALIVLGRGVGQLFS
jgi:membrane-associated protein